MAIYYRFGITLARLCFTLFARWEVEGKEYIPPRGPLIVVANHLSNADPPFIMASLNRRVFALGKRSLFKKWWASNFLLGAGVYPVSRGRPDTQAVRWVLKLLNRDQVVLLFPEGKRSEDATMKEAHPGIGYLACKSESPILPVAITGTENLSGLWRIAVPFCRIRVRIGQPFTVPLIQGRADTSIMRQYADMIMARVADLLPREFRGYYDRKFAGERDYS